MKASEIGEALGVSPQAVNKAARRGRIPREPDGSYDLAKVQAVWVKNADQHQRARGLKANSTKAKPAARHSRRPEPARPKVAASADPEFEGDISLAEAQRQSEWLKCEKQRIELAKLEGRLVDADGVKLETEARFASEKEALLNWPTRVSLEIAAELGVDERLVHQTLDTQVRLFLAERSAVPVPTA